MRRPPACNPEERGKRNFPTRNQPTVKLIVICIGLFAHGGGGGEDSCGAILIFDTSLSYSTYLFSLWSVIIHCFRKSVVTLYLEYYAAFVLLPLLWITCFWKLFVCSFGTRTGHAERPYCAYILFAQLHACMHVPADTLPSIFDWDMITIWCQPDKSMHYFAATEYTLRASTRGWCVRI